MNAVAAPRRRIGRAPNALQIVGIPVASVMLGSLMSALPLILVAPLFPPLGFMVLVGWRLLHRGILPAWAGILLGLFDDLVSGQPVGSAMMLWTVTLIGLDLVDQRMLWRDFAQDWAIACGLIGAALLLGLFFANLTGGNTPPWLLVPQMAISMLAFPLVMRGCARLDALRFS